MGKPIIVGISGGVDSSVTALLLQQQGYDVECVFMKNWEGNDDENCTAEEDYKDALAVCDHLNLPLRSVNFAKEYWDGVFQYFIDEYAKGRTPNPDVLCNREVKFKAFLDYSIELGADKIATGHYARIDESNGQFKLLKGLDPGKDQSYFLYLLGQKALSKSMFPIGEIEKINVRKLAQDSGLINHAKKDSTGVCFIGEQKFFKDFLKKYIPTKPGKMKTINGQVCGEHDGLMYYTMGQRKGLGIGGGYGEKEAPWFVAEKDLDQNTLIVAQGHDHPALFHQHLSADQIHWTGATPPDDFEGLYAKIRYRQSDQKCEITELTSDSFSVKFDQPQFAITPGQSIVFYLGDECLGGGIIKGRN
ncbi:MAG: tRNA 2-thiouridine(34) synthase MnmA [Candidatus Marinimicrobia bacterium]|jgi:tRNA-specific 2-thiouridylase|nr:tRNA 2-thiouridine(34) synthase MnmA [Candidatus Neomarinimicrobiota bacterium]MBT3675492.1 tRNA 2-thiouridine(34) synthase MnmA [Candidatus Neomarinimicrobiota bacterium]MBT3762796.1 tRNA 2-thiouridine(34) synthase MnmA [Candidatus Neomarinimicrobiota bacterium]MBT4069276.1 tRNA 2-thiouridine(34) synthase MnmA [Candidatus Neomarinimicrobiota bacterium]MBT4270417.1 tRNA 2-thiouridine(34) synthase MnmA [Candidatus Neomarinimicrobiota bacterium]